MEKILTIIGKILRSPFGVYAIAWGIIFKISLIDETLDSFTIEDIVGIFMASGILAFPLFAFLLLFTIPFFQLKDKLEIEREIRDTQKILKIEEEREA